MSGMVVYSWALREGPVVMIWELECLARRLPRWYQKKDDRAGRGYDIELEEVIFEVDDKHMTLKQGLKAGYFEESPKADQLRLPIYRIVIAPKRKRKKGKT